MATRVRKSPRADNSGAALCPIADGFSGYCNRDGSKSSNAPKNWPFGAVPVAPPAPIPARKHTPGTPRIPTVASWVVYADTESGFVRMGTVDARTAAQAKQAAQDMFGRDKDYAVVKE